MKLPAVRTVVGVVLFVFGITLIAVPDVTPTITTAPEVVELVGLLAILAGIHTLWSSRRADRSSASPPTPETPATLPVPGQEFDEQLERASSVSARSSDRKRWLEARAGIRGRLYAIAVATLVDSYNMSENEARLVLTEGTWTNDRYASAFFTESSSTPSFGPRLGRLLPFSGPGFDTQVKHVILELQAIADDERDVHELTPGEMLDAVPERPAERRSGSEGGSVEDGVEGIT